MLIRSDSFRVEQPAGDEGGGAEGFEKKYYSWLLDYSRKLLNPFVLHKDQLKSYAGIYGPRKITLQGEALFYQRGEGPKMRMIPFAEDCFIFSELDYFRIRFLRAGGKLSPWKVIRWTARPTGIKKNRWFFLEQFLELDTCKQ